MCLSTLIGLTRRRSFWSNKRPTAPVLTVVKSRTMPLYGTVVEEIAKLTLICSYRLPTGEVVGITRRTSFRKYCGSLDEKDPSLFDPMDLRIPKVHVLDRGNSWHRFRLGLMFNGYSSSRSDLKSLWVRRS